MNLGGKKLFLIGFAVVLLIGIPLTVYLLQQQQEVRSRAEKSTIVTFSPDSTQAAPIQKAVGDTIPLDITVDPGKNLVSYVKLEIQYDPEVLATASANAFQVNTTAFPSVLEGPIYTPGKIAVSLSVGSDPTKSIQQKVKAATVSFVALKNTAAGTPTLVSYGTSPKTQVLSIGSNDQASEDVLSSAAPAVIAIGGAGPLPSDQPIPTGSLVPTVPVSEVPTVAPSSPPDPTAIPQPSEIPTATVAPSAAPSGSASQNQMPVCTSLVADRATSGNAPFSVTFTANGSDSDGTISKVTLNFGDGQQSDITSSGGIGTNSVNAQASHTYNNPGTYQASAVLSDDASGISSPNENCKQTVTVTASGSATPGGGSSTPIVTPATGSFENTLVIAAAIVALIVGGGFLFFFI